MFATRDSSRGGYTYLIEVEKTQYGREGRRYAAVVAQIVDHSIGDRITHNPQFNRQHGDTPEEAISRACADADRLLSRFAHPPEIATLVFDSDQAPAPSGLRAGTPGSRKLLYAAGGHLIDLQVQRGNAGIRNVLVGQITSPDHPEWRYEGSRVVLERDVYTIARTTTNRFGEFDIEFDGPTCDLCLTFSHERAGVVIKLGNLMTRMPA